MKKYILISYFLFLISYLSYGQVNLVPNPSFEQLDSCPTNYNQIMYAPPWFQTFTNASGNQVSSSDLYSTCCASFSCSVPFHSIGNQLPKSGNSYAGIILYAESSSTREYIETLLLDSLTSTTSYCVQFYFSIGDKSKWAVSNIGAYFSNDSCLQIIPPFIELPYTPQIENTDTVIVKDKINWQRISLPYQAQGGERFMTIGNFYDDNNTNVMFFGGSTFYDMAYYYFDDVSVIDISTPAYAGVDTTITIGDSIFIGRQPEIGLNDDCVWYVNGNPIDTIAGLWVMPDSTTTYILEQTICGYTTYVTVTVTVLPTNIEAPKSPKGTFSIYPNPSSTSFTVSLTDKSISELNIVIKDVMGKIVYVRNNLTLSESKTEVDFDVQSGVYFVTVNHGNTNKSVTKKLIVNR